MASGQLQYNFTQFGDLPPYCTCLSLPGCTWCVVILVKGEKERKGKVREENLFYTGKCSFAGRKDIYNLYIA